MYRVILKHLLSICHELCTCRHVWAKLMLKTHFYIPLHSCLRQSYYTVHFIHTHISGIDYAMLIIIMLIDNLAMFNILFERTKFF